MRKVVVVGGGLAGMVSAREIAKRGLSVVLLEAGDRLGGKAGADAKNGIALEHGYHVFPTWYPNVRALLSEIEVTLVDFDRYHYLQPGAFPQFVTVRAPTGIGPIVHNVTQGLLPWYHMLLFFSFTVDMLSQPLSNTRLLDQVSEVGLMRQAWYVTDAVAELNQENMLKASAIPAYEISAMTAKKIGNFWIRQAKPFLSVLPGDLQSTFIEPLAKSVRAAGVEVRLGARVVGLSAKDGRVAEVELADGTTIDADAFVLAAPFEVVREWMNGPILTLDPSLGNMHLLQSEPMSSLHVRFKKKIEGIPREHVFFHGGAYGLSFIDVAQIWKDRGPTELSFIASNFAPLAAESEDDAAAALLGEARQYLPFDDADVAWRELESNLTTPLFLNTIGAWPNRPNVETLAPNLFFAGDFVRNPIDLACMEGAVTSALSAARAVLRKSGSEDLPEVVSPPTYPRALLLALKTALFPATALAYVAARVVEARGAPRTPKTEDRRRVEAGRHRKTGT